MKNNTEQPKEIEAPKTLEEVAKEIESLSAAIKKLNSGRLKRRAITVLIRDSISPPMSLNDINAVLDASADLASKYLK